MLSNLTSRLLVTVSLCLISISTFAWNAIGHMVVANIAYQNLTPQARAKVDKMVGELNQEYPEMKTFVNIAYWPDSIRSQHIESFTHWHYIDNPYVVDGLSVPVPSIIDTDNAVWAVKTIEQVVKNNDANGYDRARFLSFITHISGDLHQPLHTTALVSEAHPKGDKGGNAYYVKFNNERINAHKIWDMGLGVFSGESSIVHTTDIANSIVATYPKAYFGNAVNELDPTVWAQEGVENAKKYVYSTPENQPVSNAYIETGKQLSQKQAALAGYRLANLLNQLLA